MRKSMAALVVCALTWVAGGVVPVPAQARSASPSTPAMTEAAPGGIVSFGSGEVQPLVPARLLDTREGVGVPATGKVGPDSVTVLQVAGRGGVPAIGAGAVVLNVTSTEATQSGFVTVFPTGVERPLASNLNVPPGSTVANLVVAKLGLDGTVSLYNSHGDAHLIADVTGWFPEVSGLRSMTPARLLDTREGVGAPVGAVGPGSTTTLKVTGREGIPETGVGAVIVNVTVTQPTEAGFVTVYPSGTTPPLASNLNFAPGLTVPNLVIAKVGSDGSIDLFNAAGSVHLIADVAGWFADTSSLHAMTPARLLDTREGVGAPQGPVVGGTAVALQVAGREGLPTTGVGAVALNVTVTQPSANGFVTAFPAGVEMPTASNLNFRPGQTVPNLVVAKVGTDGVVNLYNSHGASHLIADVVGWFPDAASGSTTEMSLLPGTVLAGAGDVISVSGSSDAGGSVVLAASADVPPVGGHLAIAPQPLAPTGMFGRVTAVTAGGDGTVTVELARAVLEAGFSDIDVDTTGTSLPTPGAGGFAPMAADCEGDGGLGVSPSVQFTADSVDVDLDLFDRHARLLLGGTASVGLTAQFSGSYSCSTDFWGGLFVIGPTVVSVYPRMSLTVSAALKTSATVTGNVALGFEADGDGVENLSDFGIDAGGDLDAELSASVTFRPSIRADLKLFGIAGATIDLGVDIGGVVEPLGLPCISLTAQATLDIGFEVGRWGVDWNVTLASLAGPKLVLVDKRTGCPAEDTAWVGHVDVTYNQPSITQITYDDQGVAAHSYTFARATSYRVESIESSLMNRMYFSTDAPDDLLVNHRSMSWTTAFWSRGVDDPHPCNSTYQTKVAEPWELYTQLLSSPDGELVNNPDDGDTVYMLFAAFLPSLSFCSDGSPLGNGPQSAQTHLGDEHDIDFDCLAPAVPAPGRGYCLLPLTVTENGTRLRYQGTLSGTHHYADVSGPASQTVDIDLRKISNV